MLLNMARNTRRFNITCLGYSVFNINFNTILLFITTWCTTMVTMSTANYHISHLRPNVSTNIISLLCEDLSSNIYVANAAFWKDSVHRVDNIMYGTYTAPNTSATITLTPQEEGNYTCNRGEQGEDIPSCNHLLLLAYPKEVKGQKYRYVVQVGDNVTMSCPFARGALFQYYTFQWIVGFSHVREDDPRYVLNHTTFELTIIRAEFEDGDVEYVCQVQVHTPIGNNWIGNSRYITLNVTNGNEVIEDPSSTAVGPTSTGGTVIPVFTTTPTTSKKKDSSSTVIMTVAITSSIIVVMVCLTCVIIGVALILMKRNRNSIEVDSNKPNSSNGSMRELSIMESCPEIDLERRTHTVTSVGCSSSSFYKKPLHPTSDYPPCCDVQFVGSIEVVDCDRMGGVYSNGEHSIKVWVKRDSFPIPTNEELTDDGAHNSIEIEIGAAIHGRFIFPDDMRPVSAIVWLNVADKENFEFTKAVEIELGHFLQLTKTEIEEKVRDGHLGCLMAESNLEEQEGSTPVEFTKGNSNQFIFMQRCGKIWTRRSSYLCLCATKSLIDSNSLYCLVSAVPRPPHHSTERTILFFVCYNLSTFIQVIKNELKTCSTFSENEFVFNSTTTTTTDAPEEDEKISISFGQKSASKGWLLTLPTDSNEVSARAVELWEDDVSDLRLRLQHKMYPPRVRVLATTSERAQNSQEEFTISGAQFLHNKKKSELTMQIPLLIR